MSTEELTSRELIGSELVQEDVSYADIVIHFLDGLSRRLTTMEDALREADFEALRGAAHQLKGSGGGYGYPILTEVAAKLEQHAKSNSLEACAAQIEELKELSTRVVVNVD